MPAVVPKLHVLWKATDQLYWKVKQRYVSKSRQDQEFRPPVNGAYPSDYVGPKWRNAYVGRQNPNMDDSKLDSEEPAEDQAEEKLTQDESVYEKYSSSIHQYQIYPGIWWGAETSMANEIGTPIWLDIERSGDSPLKDGPSWILIELNKRSKEATPNFGISLWIMNNQKPKIIDYQSQTVEDIVSAPPLTPGSSIRLGILPACGRIIFNYNGQDFIYTKKTTKKASKDDDSLNVDPDTFDFRPFAYQIKDLAVFGSNCQAIISISAMTFTPCVFNTPLPGYLDKDEKSGPWPADLHIQLGQNPKATYGICARNFNGAKVEYAEEAAYEQLFKNPQGDINLNFVESKNKASGSQGGKYGQIKMSATPMFFGNSQTPVENMGAPFLSRLRYIEPRTKTKISSRYKAIPRSGEDIDDDVISVTLNFQAADSYSVGQTAEVTLYNEGGRHDDLLKESKGIEISLGWNNTNKLFTGVTLGGSRSEVAGMETINIHCEDYMFILDSARMITSPYYDGLDAFDCVFDIARRTGISPLDDTGEPRFALPCGYSFTKPAMRFNKGRSLKDCIIEIAKMAECVVYFDESGSMHYSPIQGGLAFDLDYSTVEEFSKKPDTDDPKKIILEELKIEEKVGQAVNAIFLETVDRTSGSLYFMQRLAKDTHDLFPFRKPVFIPQAALGSWQAANRWIAMLSERLFKAPTSVAFKTVSDKSIIPMSFIKVDGQDYRVTSLQRSYRADSNELTTNISAEWYGAR
jgi:hypothetical protein